MRNAGRRTPPSFGLIAKSSRTRATTFDAALFDEFMTFTNDLDAARW